MCINTPNFGFLLLKKTLLHPLVCPIVRRRYPMQTQLSLPANKR